MKRTAILNVVGLTDALLGAGMPRLAEFARHGAKATIIPAFPAVTCTAQANYLTGRTPSHHGIVANGWYQRELAEVHFWKQSNALMAGPKIWDALRAQNPAFTCAQLFWWFNMYAKVDRAITPRPIYPADGRKIFDIYTQPLEMGPRIQNDLGRFPFPAFWGPAAGVDSPQFRAEAVSKWIAHAAQWVEQKDAPTLNLIYLPHLDYNLQRLRPTAVQSGQTDDLARLDAIVGDLIAFFQSRDVGVMVLSEYGIEAVDTPVHLNRLFRRKGWLQVKEELGLEILDAGASKVFAVADHQVAHIYLNDPALESAVRDAVQGEAGVETVLGAAEKSKLGLDHPRSGDLVAVARAGAWFTYYYWLEDARAPDFARCVDIHRKPGYDPAELFLDPAIPLVKMKILWRLLQKRLGFRMLMDVIPLDATLVRGSHGRRGEDRHNWPVLICDRPAAAIPAEVDSTEIAGIIQRQVNS